MVGKLVTRFIVKICKHKNLFNQFRPVQRTSLTIIIKTTCDRLIVKKTISGLHRPPTVLIED